MFLLQIFEVLFVPLSNSAGFPRLLHEMSWNFYWNISRTWTVLESPGNLFARSLNLLGNDAEDSFWLQIDILLQMKMSTTVETRYVF